MFKAVLLSTVALTKVSQIRRALGEEDGVTAAPSPSVEHSNPAGAGEEDGEGSVKPAPAVAETAANSLNAVNQQVANYQAELNQQQAQLAAQYPLAGTPPLVQQAVHAAAARPVGMGVLSNAIQHQQMAPLLAGLQIAEYPREEDTSNGSSLRPSLVNAASQAVPISYDLTGSGLLGSQVAGLESLQHSLANSLSGLNANGGVGGLPAASTYLPSALGSGYGTGTNNLLGLGSNTDLNNYLNQLAAAQSNALASLNGLGSPASSPIPGLNTDLNNMLSGLATNTGLSTLPGLVGSNPGLYQAGTATGQYNNPNSLNNILAGLTNPSGAQSLYGSSPASSLTANLLTNGLPNSGEDALEGLSHQIQSGLTNLSSGLNSAQSPLSAAVGGVDIANYYQNALNQLNQSLTGRTRRLQLASAAQTPQTGLSAAQVYQNLLQNALAQQQAAIAAAQNIAAVSAAPSSGLGSLSAPNAGLSVQNAIPSGLSAQPGSSSATLGQTPAAAAAANPVAGVQSASGSSTASAVLPAPAAGSQGSASAQSAAAGSALSAAAAGIAAPAAAAGSAPSAAAGGEPKELTGFNASPWILPAASGLGGGFGNAYSNMYGQQKPAQNLQQYTVADILKTLSNSDANLTRLVSEISDSKLDVNNIVRSIVQGRPSFDAFMKELAVSNLDVNAFLKDVVDKKIDVNTLIKQLAGSNVSVDQLFRNLVNGGVDFNKVLASLAASGLDLDSGLKKLGATGIDAALVLNSPALPGMVNAGVLTNPQLGDLLSSLPSSK